MCAGLGEKCLPYVLRYEDLVSSWWHCLRRIRRSGFAGGSTSVTGSGVSDFKAQFHFLFVLSDSCSHHTCSLPPCFPIRMSSYPSGIIRQNKVLSISCFFNTAAKKELTQQIKKQDSTTRVCNLWVTTATYATEVAYTTENMCPLLK